MSIFEKQIILYEGRNKLIYQGYQNLLRNHDIRFKPYATDDQLKGGCCGLNSKNGSHQVTYTYTIFVKSKDAKTAQELISQFKLP